MPTHRSFPHPSSPIVYKHSKSIRIPSSSRGTPDDWAAMAGPAAVLVAEGLSVSMALGRDPEKQSAGPDEMAEQLMTSRERSLYSNWRKRHEVPPVDWKRLRTSITGAPSHRRRWQSFVPALSTIYSTKVSPENCKAWAEKYPDMMPLLVAVRKVETVHRDARGVKGNSKARKDFYEIVACRKLMSDIGTQRISSNKELKAKNRAAGEKEMELVKKIARMDKTSMPSDRDSAEKKFEARDIAWKKLTRIRTARVTDVATVRRQNVELGALEAAVKARITALQERLEKEARGGSSSKSSRK